MLGLSLPFRRLRSTVVIAGALMSLGGLGGCATESGPKVQIPEYSATEVTSDREALAKTRAELARHEIIFEKEGRRWALAPTADKPLDEGDRLLLKNLVDQAGRFLERYNRDHRVDGRLTEANPLEMDEARQERQLARRLLEKSAVSGTASGDNQDPSRPSEAFLHPAE